LISTFCYVPLAAICWLSCANFYDNKPVLIFVKKSPKLTVSNITDRCVLAFRVSVLKINNNSLKFHS